MEKLRLRHSCHGRRPRRQHPGTGRSLEFRSREQPQEGYPILGNSIDDPEHEAKLELVHESRETTVEIFGDSCSEKHLGFDEAQANEAIFVPISAAHAFLYRKVGEMTSENLKSLDKDILDGMVQQEIVPKKWLKLSHKRKCEVVLEIINDTLEYDESLNGTNFHNFLLRFAFLYWRIHCTKTDSVASDYIFSREALSNQCRELE